LHKTFFISPMQTRGVFSLNPTPPCPIIIQTTKRCFKIFKEKRSKAVVSALARIFASKRTGTMLEIGKMNTLRVVKEVEFGLYLDGYEKGEILLPKRYVPEGTQPEDQVTVFIYTDSEDRLIATTENPHAQVGEFALMKAVAVNKVGAFFDWGLQKDLLVPYREQKGPIEKDQEYVVAVYLDSTTNRVVGSTKVEKYLDNLFPDFEEGQEVDLYIYGRNELGYKAIVNNLFSGMLYKNELFQSLERGQRLKGFIKKIRPDQKLDLCLNKPGFEKIDSLSERILAELHQGKGFIALNDKSTAEAIYLRFQESKKTFKKAIGALYKKHLITIEEEGIRLVNRNSKL